MALKAVSSDVASSTLSASRAAGVSAMGGGGMAIRRVDAADGSEASRDRDAAFDFASYDDQPHQPQGRRPKVIVGNHFGDVLTSESVARSLVANQANNTNQERPRQRAGIAAYQMASFAVQTGGYMARQGGTINRLL